jgi:hypothetical protein
MIKVNNGKEVYSIPASWSEVTFKQYKDLQGEKDEAKILSILCNMPTEIVECLSVGSINKIASVISFIKEPINLDDNTPPEYLTVLDGLKIDLVKDIRECSFGQKIWLHETVKDSQDNLIDKLHDIVLIYSQPQITKKDFDINKINELNNVFDEIFLVNLYATAMNYILQLKNIIEIESETLSSQPTQEQKHAGIDMFNDFGVMNTIKALAGGDITKYAEVEKIEYNVVYVHMLMNKTQNVFEENYRKIMKNKR